jgi:dUTP pyrophosphatase
MLPTRATPEATGYVVYSAETITIQPHSTVKVPLDIAITPPPHTYCQLLSRSSLYTKHHVEVKTGTIDRDYMGIVMVVLHNNGSQPYTVTIGQCIAQLVIYSIVQPPTKIVDALDSTLLDDGGFGSTGDFTTPSI